LRNNEQLYRDSLKAASDWVGQHLDTNAGDTQAMLDELKQGSPGAACGTRDDRSHPTPHSALLHAGYLLLLTD